MEPRAQAPAGTTAIDLSIVMPVYNEARRLGRTLDRITSALSDFGRYEVIVVDNGSTDATAQITSGYPGIRLIQLEKRETVAFARNAGATNSTGVVLAFIDADILITAEWAAALRGNLSELMGGPDVVTGARPLISETPGWLEQSWFLAIERRSPVYVNSGNLIISRAAFDKIQGFDETLSTGEDVDFCLRADALAIEIRPDTAYVAHHEGYPKSIGAFFRRELWHGRGDFSSIGIASRSQPLLAGVLVVSLSILAILLLVLGRPLASLIAAGLTWLTCLGVVAIKFGLENPRQLLVNSGVAYVYCVARALAFVNYEKRK